MAGHPLSLHQLTLLDVSPSELVEIAARLGLGHVGVFVRGVGRAGVTYPLVDTEQKRREILAALGAHDVRVHNLEVFPVASDFNLDSYRPALDMGAAIGAKRLTSSIFDADLARAQDNFAVLCDYAASIGLDVHIEFSGFAVVNSLAKTRAFLARHRPANASVAVDALHLYRNDGGTDGLGMADAAPIGYAQINDGPLQSPLEPAYEAVVERGMPGTGAFDLKTFVAGIPEGIVIDVECPSQSLKDKGLSPLERARAMVDAARRFVQEPVRA